MKLNIKKCREMLGPPAQGKTDSEIEDVLNTLTLLAEIAIESLLKKRNTVIDNNNIDNNNIDNNNIDTPKEAIEYEARRIAEALDENDDKHIGFYIKTVRDLPPSMPGMILSEVKDDAKRNNIRSEAKLYVWKVNNYRKTYGI
jgi:hypothetical protein